VTRSALVPALLALLTGPALLTGSALAAQETYRVVGIARGDSLNIRERPDADSPVVGQIPPNARRLRGFGCTDDTPSRQAWCRIKYRDNVGWVRHNFLRYD
jgi:uncharacterized protein YraI